MNKRTLFLYALLFKLLSAHFYKQQFNIFVPVIFSNIMGFWGFWGFCPGFLLSPFIQLSTSHYLLLLLFIVDCVVVDQLTHRRGSKEFFFGVGICLGFIRDFVIFISPSFYSCLLSHYLLLLLSITECVIINCLPIVEGQSSMEKSKDSDFSFKSRTSIPDTQVALTSLILLYYQ